ncbi:beta-2 adrenergic receptor-like [Amphiura filiformis]|uniref:beta-2 adrenergic receptor-like n=1 Tax=Amphiura filiformis TaxID=82378 RepID=UPI003B215C9A
MNISNTTTTAPDYDWEWPGERHWYWPSYWEYWEQILLAVLLGLVAITGLIGNSMIIAAVAFSKKLQTSTNAFVTSLGVADLLTSFTLVWYVVGLLGENEWPIPGAYWICQLTGFMIFACIGTSMWTLGMIAINRLILLIKPIWYEKIFTSWKLAILVAIPWVIPEAFLLTLHVTGDVTYAYAVEECSVWAHSGVFIIVQSVIGLIPPLLAIVGSYIWIYVYIKKYFRRQKQHLSQFSDSSTNDDSQSPGMQNTTSKFMITEEGHDPNSDNAVQRRKQISKQEIEITKNLFVVVIGFFACFIPYFIMHSFRESTINNANIEHAFFYVKGIPFINSVINFIIYAMKHPDFKVVLRHMMRCSYADIPQPSPILKYLLSRKNQKPDSRLQDEVPENTTMLGLGTTELN